MVKCSQCVRDANGKFTKWERLFSGYEWIYNLNNENFNFQKQRMQWMPLGPLLHVTPPPPPLSCLTSAASIQ